MGLFVIATLINPIIMLSLLISIIGNIYEKIQYNDLISDRKEVARIVLEGELSLFTKVKKEKTYLHICVGENGLKHKNVWYGVASKIDKSLAELKKLMQNNSKTSETATIEIKDKLKTFDKTDAQKEQKTKEKEELNKKLNDILAMNDKIEALKNFVEANLVRDIDVEPPQEEPVNPEEVPVAE